MGFMRYQKKLRKSKELSLQKTSMWYNINIKIGGESVAISYKKLWKLLIDRNIKKGELQQLANVSASSIAKLGKNENVNTDILVRICKALNCSLEDIMELAETDNAKEQL